MPLSKTPGRFEFRIGPDSAGRRLDQYLADKFRRSRTSVRDRLEGCIFDARGIGLRWSHRLRHGEIILVQGEVRPEPEVVVAYRVLVVDPWIVAVDKGPGAPVHPARGFRTRTVLTRLREELGDPTLQLGHRLDRETSGVLLCGRSVPVLHNLMEQFASRKVQKRYLAVVRGNPRFERLRIEARLAIDPIFPIRCRMRVDPEHGQPAVTDLEVLERREDRALVAAIPRTGRQHQIRLHLAHLGHPVLGDKLYQENGKPYLDRIKDRITPETLARLGHHRQALHAERLALAHPHTGEPLVLEAPFPDELRALLFDP